MVDLWDFEPPRRFKIKKFVGQIFDLFFILSGDIELGKVAKLILHVAYLVAGKSVKISKCADFLHTDKKYRLARISALITKMADEPQISAVGFRIFGPWSIIG